MGHRLIWVGQMNIFLASMLLALAVCWTIATKIRPLIWPKVELTDTAIQKVVCQTSEKVATVAAEVAADTINSSDRVKPPILIDFNKVQ